MRIDRTQSGDTAASCGLEGLLRIPEVARILGIREKTLREWVWRRKITFIKVGKRVAFRPSDIREFIEMNIVKAAR